MHTALWIIQIILGIKLLSVAHTHGLRQSQPTMQDAIRRMGRMAQPLHYAIALLAFAGAVGLILPGLLGLQIQIVSATAVFMAVMLLFSIFFHIRSREKANVFVSVVLFAFALFIAYGRRVLAP